MTDLSPAAQAAWDAYERVDCDPYEIDPRKAGLSAALEAVVAKTKQRQYGTCWICDANELLAIAAELRGDTTTETQQQ